MQSIPTIAPPDLVVVIDDDAAVRDALQFSLQIEGFAVRTYPGAWDLLIEGHMAGCSCLVVDQNMAEMTGLELIDRLRAHQVSAPAILITTNPNALVRERAAKAGIPIVEKPLLGSALTDRIRQSLEQSRAASTASQHLPRFEQESTMIKDILVNLTIDAPRDVSGDYALSVAAAFGAHLTGVAFAYEPVVPGTIFETGTAAAIIDAHRIECRKSAAAARDAFDQAARLAGVEAEARLIDSGAAGAADAFGRLARAYDLSIVGQARPDSTLPEDLIVEAALFSSGRPVLVVPYIQRTGLKLDRVMVCWDGSRNAARAVGEAMPLLQRASAIDVVTIDSRERRNELIGIDIAEHLARHGLKVELKQVVATDPDIASTILSYAADNAADLLVMGGYGHSRLREFVLGGATRGVLGSMTVPTLMAH